MFKSGEIHRNQNPTLWKLLKQLLIFSIVPCNRIEELMERFYIDLYHLSLSNQEDIHSDWNMSSKEFEKDCAPMFILASTLIRFPLNCSKHVLLVYGESFKKEISRKIYFAPHKSQCFYYNVNNLWTLTLCFKAKILQVVSSYRNRDVKCFCTTKQLFYWLPIPKVFFARWQAQFVFFSYLQITTFLSKIV